MLSNLQAPCWSLSPLPWTITHTVSVINTIAMDLYWPHARHDHCCYGCLLTSWSSWPRWLWTFTDLMSVITTVGMDHHWHHFCHHHSCHGPFLTSWSSWPLLLWAITSTISVITTDAMNHYWHQARHQHCCYGPPLTPCPLLQCVPQSRVCDGQKDCYNGVDEELCSNKIQRDYSSPDPPAIVQLNSRGEFALHALNNSQLSAFSPANCPPTHFQCPGQWTSLCCGFLCVPQT